MHFINDRWATAVQPLHGHWSAAALSLLFNSFISPVPRTQTINAWLFNHLFVCGTGKLKENKSARPDCHSANAWSRGPAGREA